MARRSSSSSSPTTTTSPPTTAPAQRDAASPPTAAPAVGSFQWWREGIEAVAIALILAFLIRSFEAEAFVIPTGSMAPTLFGRHKDLVCPQCGYKYQVGASEDAEELGRGQVIQTSCPMCFYPHNLDQDHFAADGSFTGDRIIVDKLAYEWHDPRRWQVVVFKFPGSAKQNYIKRLIGLPGETIRIHHGDIFVKGAGESSFQIARKPPRTQWYMLQCVHDTRYTPETLVKAGFPSRWFAPEANGWEVSDDQREFHVAAEDRSWLRYRHLLPSETDWQRASQSLAVDTSKPMAPELISDMYAYNNRKQEKDSRDDWAARQRGIHWVGDLGVHADLRIEKAEGTVWLDLVEGGRHFRCAIDVATGTATVSIDDGQLEFLDEQGLADQPRRTAPTGIQGKGNHSIRFTNADDRLLLWVDGQLCRFDGPTTFDSGDDVVPKWSLQDPGDLYPIGIGAEQTELSVYRLKVLRDIYYVAVKRTPGVNQSVADYDWMGSPGLSPPIREIFDTFGTPQAWSLTDLFESRRAVEFQLKDEADPGHDQFFMMGDNSPESSDGRLWNDGHYVEGRLLLGRAKFIYWPHPWYLTFGKHSLPISPQFSRMGLIH